MNSVVRAEDLSKEYPLPKGTLCVFERLNFELDRGDIAAIMGVSGVGKTTFLNLIAAIDYPTEGTVYLEGIDIFGLSQRERAQIRNKKIGFIFQFYHLLPEFTALENVSFPLLIGGAEKKEAQERGLKILQEVFLMEKAYLRPGKLSGGEQQRVAIARALINEPRLLLADEPTGNLDWGTGQNILELIRTLHTKKDLSSIIVTHNEKVAQFCDKTYLMEGGQLKLLSRL
ncbi:MAG: ABC transporter ATP-binding protein [Candidatus Aminicenantes bacterium]|jgi:ABC-type lipoprotein export system ATPase subunit|nr:ABC transporter ATP-binding protein [Candidatus Aminicenantes bacterium]MDH5384710.1 ABC transporter ATP-binding protein [Candidatus Aminicenantes bacterium]MDH5742018.1 ABC transporter ATP-binding protein [Candidatus Aminicenantes bacterium]